MRRSIDILCAGELLVDMISADFVEKLDDAINFRRIPGGSPANLAMNMARLGGSARLVASVGSDDMGIFLKNFVEKTGVDCSGIAQVEEPTTLILVSRSAGVSNFEAYRAADQMISIRQFPYSKFSDLAVFHTTCFALSRKPAQTVILEAADKAARAGCELSIDVNYAPKIWPNRSEAQKIVAEFVRFGAKVKCSEVDWERLYGEKMEPEQAIKHFLALGAREICLTLGGDGCWVASESERHFLPSRKIEVKDTTGAGDAFWSGYLTARLDEKTILEAAVAGRKMAETKLAIFGPLPEKVEKAQIYSDLD